jgi:outer membrane lipoprotein-sorting protein
MPPTDCYNGALRRHNPTTSSRLKLRTLPLLLALAATATGCLYRTRNIAPPLVAARTATLEELLPKIERFGAIETLRAEAEIGLTYLDDEMDDATTVRDVRGFILAERPDHARIQAQYPVTHQTAFDMVSDSEEFSVYLVWRKRFLQGDTAFDVRSDKRAENIRPQHVVEPLLIDPPQDGETAALDNQARNGQLYHVVAFRKKQGDNDVITRKFWFDRTNLQLGILEIYDGAGNVVTQASYSDWRDAAEGPYAGSVSITRPVDGYSLVVHIQNPGLNATLPPDAFVLDPPPGVPVERVGDAPRSAAQLSNR